MKPIYQSLAAAYGWTYEQVDGHTLGEVNELFAGWDDYPPTNILVKALVEGFGVKKKPKTDGEDFVVPQEAQDAMQRSAVGAIAAKADPRWLPVTRGRDRGLPKAAPVFDLTELRERNLEALRKRVGTRKR